jgi:hypothetical protein
MFDSQTDALPGNFAVYGRKKNQVAKGTISKICNTGGQRQKAGPIFLRL